MNIYYDYQTLCIQRYGGISRYYFELISTINQMHIARADIDCYFSKNAYFENHFKKPAVKRYYGTYPFVRLLNKAHALWRIHHDCDIVCPTYFDLYVLIAKKLFKAKLVVTVYDMIYEMFPSQFPSADKSIANKKILIENADHIIAISHSTKRDIMAMYPTVPSDKITVIHIGTNFSSIKPQYDGEALPEKFILFVGSRKGYKNFKCFFHAVKPLLMNDSSLYVVCVGGGSFNQMETEMFGVLKNKIHHKVMSDGALAYTYSRAVCFVFPSQYEGFGIPTLEAFACSCPVVLSNSSSMPEVGGDAVVYFDPNDQDAIQTAISSVVNDERLRRKLIDEGHKQLEKFSWENIARQVVDCYQKVLDNDGLEG